MTVWRTNARERENNLLNLIFLTKITQKRKSFFDLKFDLIKWFSPNKNGTCHDLVAGFRCECSKGFKGVFCESEINECDENPCLHGSSCQDGINSYSCICLPGFEGRNCEVNINECAKGFINNSYFIIFCKIFHKLKMLKQDKVVNHIWFSEPLQQRINLYWPG